MPIDIIARGLASSLVGSDGKIAAEKMPTLNGTAELTGFTSIGKLTDASLVEGKTAEEILMMMLYGVVNPTLIDPSLSIALNDDNDMLIIGRQSSLKGTLTFDRGKIEPAYGTSGYRAGAPISYTVGEYSIAAISNQYDFEIQITPTEEKVILSCSVSYGSGEQPLNSIGQPIGAPVSAGFIHSSVELTAAYALFNQFGQEQKFEWFEDEAGQGYLSTFASESTGEKQSFAVSSAVSVVGIKSYDAMSHSWQWLGGSATASLKHFDTTIISGESLGETTEYVLYTHNQPAKGERMLRIYVM